MLSDIEIAQQSNPEPIVRIAEKLDIPEEYLEYYGRYKAKLPEELIKSVSARIRRKGRRSRRRLCSGNTYGGYKPSLYRRYACYNLCK